MKITLPPFFNRSINTQKLDKVELCRVAQDAWTKAGHESVRLWTENRKIEVNGRIVQSVEICSNLINGLPP